ncbi:MAG TPA: Smr/MutS family protein [Myxococcales bacterium LLY-WYZ-16_1]|nr:Smr/MutS family protein [Myxococcales bacterium LLY-WYZ-16_1]
MRQATGLLELERVQAALRARVRTPLGQARVRALAPLDDIEAARGRIERIREARSLIEAQETAPVFAGDDVEGAVTLAEKGVMLEGPILRQVAQTMLAGFELRRHLLPREHEVPLLYGLAASVPDLNGPARRIHRCFDPDGQLADNASPDLGTLRARVRSIRDSIHDRLQTLLQDGAVSPYLQETYYTVRGDRYVLPVKASYKNHIAGIVHDASGSGQTVFIEPQALIDLGNRLKIAQSEQADEEARILSELSVEVAKHGEDIRKICQVIGRVDFSNGAARLAMDLDAIPILPDPEPGFRLSKARHPLLVLQSIEPREREDGTLERPKRPWFEVVANDLELRPEQQVLVLTGPNTGGKTVAMKTIGLAALMVRCGLHVPCGEGSRIGWYRNLVGTLGDQQSLVSNLSTFAAHMKALMEILSVAGSGTLALIDEIAADTDPTQGQAIAQAVLEQLADKKSHVVVTTHFERLKALPFQDGRFRNAGVGFDEVALQPTYRVSLDMAQGSSAFDIAAGLGLDAGIVERARSLFGEGADSLENLLKAVERKNRELEAAQVEAAERARSLERERAEFERTQRRLEREIEDVKARARTELFEEIKEARERARKLVAELQRAASGPSAAESMRVANRVSEALRDLEASELARAEAEKPREADTEPDKPLLSLEVGQRVHVPRLGRDGEIVSVEGRDVQVAVGTVKMRVPASSLRPPTSESTSKPPSRGRSRAARRDPSTFAAGGTERPDSPTPAPEELDLRGHSVDESIERLEAFLDYHYGSPTQHVRVIHGHGTGALKEAIREHLRRSGYVKSMRPGERDEGGDGVTVVHLA